MSLQCFGAEPSSTLNRGQLVRIQNFIGATASKAFIKTALPTSFDSIREAFVRSTKKRKNMLTL